MNFMKSETRINLARAFAGESQARNRYTIYADVARKQGQEHLARIFEETADNERAHAEEFLEAMKELGHPAEENVQLDAGYPFPLGDTVDNLGFSAHGEKEEFTTIYPAFAEKAQQEGFPEVAQLFTRIATVEQQHHKRFSDYESQLRQGTIYDKPKEVQWKCLNCGYTYTAASPAEHCPVCHKPKGWAEAEN